MKKVHNFIKSHNLVNRIYDMVSYLDLIKEQSRKDEFKKFFYDNLFEVDYVESLAKYFESKLKQNLKNDDLKCNLKELINDLNYLKQYLS